MHALPRNAKPWWRTISPAPLLKISAEFRYRSARHEGLAWLEMDIDADSERLVGYYTQRKTSGDMDVRRTSRVIG